MTLSAFILLPTFMCISRHDRRDNRARAHYRECQSIVVTVRYRVALSAARLHNHVVSRGAAPPPALINLSRLSANLCAIIRRNRVEFWPPNLSDSLLPIFVIYTKKTVVAASIALKFSQFIAEKSVGFGCAIH